jgi:glycosyltransferase involved in cell wall biosynthesis
VRDVGQVEAVRVSPDVDVLYGHIVFPTCGRLPTVWSTAGVIDARPGIWFPEQSTQTHLYLIPRAAAVQCWSEFGKIGLLERAPKLDAASIVVIPPLVQLSITPAPRRVSADLVAIFVGANGALKGVDVVVAAAALVPEVRFEVITHTPRPEHLPANVDWLGPRPHGEVLTRLASADLHVFPSTTESLGGVVVEAMAAGIAQVVDAESVTAEVAGSGAIAIDGRSAEAVALAVRELAADDARRAACAEAGRRRYDEVYAPDAVGARLVELIESV